MIDEVEFKELQDAAAHAKHNGGRVSVDCGDLDELLGVWRRVEDQLAAVYEPINSPLPQPESAPTPERSPESDGDFNIDGKPVTRAEFDAFIASQPPQRIADLPTAPAAGELSPDAAPPVTPEPTIQ